MFVIRYAARMMRTKVQSLEAMFAQSLQLGSRRATHSMVPSVRTLRQHLAVSYAALPSGDIKASPLTQVTRAMNRNARRPKKANHGKRPCSRVRRRLKAKMIKSRAHRKPVLGVN